MNGVRLEVRNLQKSFGRHVALHNVSFVVAGGAQVGIVGESGSGKSTIVRLLLDLEHQSGGEILVNGVALGDVMRSRESRAEYRRQVQLVAQDTTATFDPRHTVGRSIRTPAQLLCGMDLAAATEASHRVANELGIPEVLLDRHPAQLSGGQRQRMAIARALIVSPDLLVCDEAVSALDVSVQGVVLNLLKDYCAHHGSGLIFVSHGLPATAFVTDELIVMNAGRIVEAGRTSEILANPSDPYSRSLVAAYSGGLL